MLKIVYLEIVKECLLKYSDPRQTLFGVQALQ